MKKELFLIRHAEAESPEIGVKDFERNLTEEGSIVASKCGKFLSNLINTPDVVICSSSIRTVQTTGRIVEQLQFNSAQIQKSDEIYEASTRILLREVTQLGEENKKVVIVAHNPAVSYLSEYITGAEIGNIPPAGIVQLSIETPWVQISEKTASLIQYYPPQLYQTE